MIDRISQYAAGFLASIDGVEDDRFLIYQVGFDVLLSTWITVAGISGLSIILRNQWGAVFFLLCFMTVRSYSGGYHAKTRTRCFLLTCGAYLFTAFPLKTELFRYDSFCSIVIAGIVIVVWYLFVPVENKNKRLPQDWKRINRVRAWISAGGWLTFSVVLHRWNEQLSFQIILTMLVITLLILRCRPWKEKL